jgi:hypothetical protein
VSTYDNGCVDTPDWSRTQRSCPFESCDVCSDNSQPISGYGTYPPNVTLGEN